MSLRFPAWLLLIASARLACAQFAGPAILSRGEAPGAISLPAIKFRPFVDFNAIYSTGLTGVTINNNGDLTNLSSTGLRLAFGISGTHRMRRTTIGLDYRGSVSHYLHTSYYDSVAHAVVLGIRHNLSRHIALNISENAGIFSRDFGLLGIPQAALYDPSSANTPTTDYFDNRTMYLTSSVNLVMQRSSRLSFSMGGGHMVISRRSEALRGNSGLSANGDVQYRFTRRSTIGASYQYQHFGYTRFDGGADTHAFSGTYAVALSARTEFSGFAGAARTEVKNLVSSPTDPVIAALLGIRESFQIIHYLSWSPNFGARISRRVPQGILHATVRRGIVPGNGLFLTSDSLTVSGGYSYLGLRRWSASASGSYIRSNAVAGITGTYAAVAGGVQLSRKIGRSVHAVTSYSVRQYDSPRYGRYQRLVNELSFGIGFTPGEVPLRIW